MQIKDIIKERRMLLGLTLEDISKTCGVSHTTVQRWESGNITDIKASKIKLLANILEVTPGYLMGWTENMENKIFEGKSDIEKIIERIHKDDNYRALLSSSLKLKNEDVLFIKDFVDRIINK